MADLEAVLRPFVDSGQVPGLVALVARGDDVEVVTLGTRGTSGVPMARDSIVRGASITKPVTAAVVMSLVDDGLVDLDDPVAGLLPVLGVLAARAAGKDFADVVAERVLEPLGMSDTGFHVPAAKVERFTTLYQGGDDGLEVSDEPDGFFTAAPAFASGSGGLVTTADDWLAFGRMLLADGGDVLRPESVRQMMTDHTTAQHREMGGFFLDGQGWGYGGGVDTSLVDPWNVIGRYGWVGGTGTSAYVHPDSGTVAVLLTQVVLGAPGIEDLLKAFWTAST